MFEPIKQAHDALDAAGVFEENEDGVRPLLVKRLAVLIEERNVLLREVERLKGVLGCVRMTDRLYAERKHEQKSGWWRKGKKK